MDRKRCRKPISDLGRTARYYLRRTLNQGGNENEARLQDQSSDSDPDEQLNLGPNNGDEADPHNLLNEDHREQPLHAEQAHRDIARHDGQPNNNMDIEDEEPPNIAPENRANENPDHNMDAQVEHLDNGPEEGEAESDNDLPESDESEDEDLIFNRVNRALYAGANISVAKSMLLVLGLMLQHNLTASCVADILTVIQFHCLHDALQKVSLFKFNKFFGLGRRGKFTKHFYCSVCLASLQNENARCQLCPANSKTAFFISMPFWVQLQEMFKINDFYNQLQARFNRNYDEQIKDIYDGTLYRNLVESGFLSNPNNISFTWYTDGVPVFKSSKTSMWPIYLCINELPYRLRIKKENILLAGLWFGPKKPSCNLFLLFVNKLRPQFEQFFHGKIFTINGNIVRVRGLLLAGTADVPAKTDLTDFLNLTVHSGAFGCVNCKLQGETFNHPSRGHSHVFPYVKEIAERTSVETVLQGRQVVQDNIREGIMGVKGVSALSLIMPEFIGGTAIDVMHKVYGGVVKKLLHLWFDASNRGERFSLAHITGNIDKRLKALKPPKFVHRMPRTVNDLCHWKASELKM